MSDSSVKDILKKFNDGSGPPVGLRPVVAGKPGRAPKPDGFNVPKDHSASNGTIKSPMGPKPFIKPGNVMALNLNDLTRVKLKKPPLPRPPGDHDHESPKPEWLQPKPKPKPVTAPRHVDGPSLSSPLPNSPTPFLPISPSRSKSEGNDSALHPKPAAKPKARPPAPHRKDSLKARGSPTMPAKPGFLSNNKENIWKNSGGENDPSPPISDSENSSGSSLTDLPSRRRSFLHDSKSSLQPARPMLQPLPPLTIIGHAPRKPARPPNVTLDRFKLTGEAQAPHLPPKPGPHSPAGPALPARPSVPIIGGRSPKAAPPLPVPEEEGLEDSGDIYDDVEANPPAPAPKVPSPSRRPRPGRPFSLIETMDSDEEQGVEDTDDIYDDAESTQAPVPEMPPRLPPHPVVLSPPVLPPHPVLSPPILPPHPTLVGDAPPPPSITSIPALHGSGGSSISFPRSVENSGSGLEDCGEIYDDVSGGEDNEELYEALDVDEGTEMDEQPRRPPDQERNKKEEERLKKEQEKLQKKEEERRKKKEKEEKKKKEKEEKDMKKKFNIKGDVNVIEEGMVTEAQDANYGKHDLPCKAGEKVEILRKEGNPPGMWLARNLIGIYGYVDRQFVRVEGSGGDFGDVYDDVIAGDDEDDCDNIYDAVN